MVVKLYANKKSTAKTRGSSIQKKQVIMFLVIVFSFIFLQLAPSVKFSSGILNTMEVDDSPNLKDISSPIIIEKGAAPSQHNLLSQYSDLTTIRKWGCHRNESPLIFVHIGKVRLIGWCTSMPFESSCLTSSLSLKGWRRQCQGKVCRCC